MGSFRDWRIVKTERRVLAAAAELGGEAAAQVWYDIPIPDLDGKSPRQLVECGKADEVFEYLSMLEAEQPWERPRARHPPALN